MSRSLSLPNWKLWTFERVEIKAALTAMHFEIELKSFRLKKVKKVIELLWQKLKSSTDEQRRTLNKKATADEEAVKKYEPPRNNKKGV